MFTRFVDDSFNSLRFILNNFFDVSGMDASIKDQFFECAPADLAGVYWGRVLPTQDGASFAYRYRRLLSDLFVVEGLR